MAEKRTCAFCRKDAIRFQSAGCSYLNVCEDHAESHIPALKPGEKQWWGECFFFERFGTNGK